MSAQTLLRILAAAAVLGMAGCASYYGAGLRPGIDGGAEVRALMGEPHHRWSDAGGGSTWEYNRGPYGRESFLARLGPDGKLRSLEQVRTEQNFARLELGKTTKDEVRRLIGTPDQVVNYARRNEQDWAYTYRNGVIRMLLWVTFDQQTGSVKQVASVLDEPDPPHID